MKIIIVNSNPIHSHLEKECEKSFGSITINKKNDLAFSKLKKIKPDYLFFIHWSFIIPKGIFENFNCVLFHMTDLPYGRGGSPLQNLIARGHSKTMISALKVEQGIDTGPIYLKKPLSLKGTAQEIFLRAGNVMLGMMKEIISKQPVPIAQKGKVVTFKRRTPDQGNLQSIDDLETVYNFIRMLDADGYPNAFLETAFFKFEFSKATLKKDSITAQVKIKRK